MPAPSRPNTSMGFNRDTLGDDDIVRPPARSKDDVTIGRTSIGLGSKAGGGVQHATTLGSSAFMPSRNAAASSSKTASTSGLSTKLVQKPLSMFMANKGGVPKPDAGARRMGAFGSKPSIFGGGLRRTVSKKSTLPVVIGSPVKGGGERGGDVSMQEAAEGEEGDDAAGGDEDGGKIFNAIVNGGSATALLADLLAQGPEKGKEKETSHRPVHSSRRVSMLSRDLSHSLSVLPAPLPPPGVSGARGAMGPPATPPMGSRVNANLGSGSGSSASGSPSLTGPTGAKRSSARIANAAPKMGSDGPSSAGKKAAAEPVNPAKKILKDCVIFVDVKSEDGDEAGSLFVEMLEGIGARVSS